MVEEAASRRSTHWVTIALAVLILTVLILLKAGIFDPWSESVPFQNVQLYFYPLVVLFFTVLVAKGVSMLLHEYFAKKSGHLRISERTRYGLFAKLATITIYLVGFGLIVYLIPGLRTLSYSLFASAGLLAIIFGFATQKTLGNLVSGVMIAIFQPYRINDKVKVGEEYGEVEDISLRHTEIKTWDNRRIIIPNSKMDEEVINNYTIRDPKILGWLDMSISYDSDIDLARQIMREEVHAHPDFLDARTAADMLKGDDPVTVRVVDLGESAVVLRLYFWAKDQSTNWKMKCDLRESVKKRFDQEGVEVPYPYLTIVQKKSLPRPKRLKKPVVERVKKK